jgi:hypothetical protein
MNRSAVLFAVLLLAFSASAQTVSSVGADSAFQVRYASNLNAGDGLINISNTGALGAALPAGTTASIVGSLCVNVYAFSPDEQMISCCSCPVTPNGLVNLTAQRDLISNTLTPAVPTSIVVKLLASVPSRGSCANSAANPIPVIPVPPEAVVSSPVGSFFPPGMVAWGTTIHSANTGGVGGPWSLTETAFTPATLSLGELRRLADLCTFINANGSGFGICRSCRLGGLGAGRQ